MWNVIELVLLGAFFTFISFLIGFTEGMKRERYKLASILSSIKVDDVTPATQYHILCVKTYIHSKLKEVK